MLKFLTSLFKPEAVQPAPATSETAMLFAVAEIGPFLIRLANNPHFGLPEGLGDEIATALPHLDLHQTRSWRIDGAFDDAPVQFGIQITLESGGEADVTFLAPRHAIEELNRELAAFDTAERV